MRRPKQGRWMGTCLLGPGTAYGGNAGSTLLLTHRPRCARHLVCTSRRPADGLDYIFTVTHWHDDELKHGSSFRLGLRGRLLTFVHHSHVPPVKLHIHIITA